MSQPLAHKFVAVAPSPAGLWRRYAAFTMAEVLFAIIVLGIGLILLAAAFPIGIIQTEKTQDATMAGLVARLAYDQMTKVPASGAIPDATWTVPPAASTAVYTWTGLRDPRDVANYGSIATGASPVTPGKALVMGFLDGTQTVTLLDNRPRPDLRVKLVYPFSLYSESLTNPTLLLPNPADNNPTLSEDCVQDETLLGRAAYDLGTVTPGFRRAVPFGLVWGFRNEGSHWLENVQWVYSADRRYYWYAFYRQMYDAPFYHPSVFPAGGVPLGAQAIRMAQVQADHITRRTYRVTIVACKVPMGQQPVQSPSVIQAKLASGDANAVPVFFNDLADCVGNNVGGRVDNRLDGAATTSYSEQWTKGGLAPVRVPPRPAEDKIGNTFLNCDTAGWVRDAGTGTYIANSINRSFVRKGGTVLDCWGGIYQVIDMTSNAIRLDRPLAVLPVGYGFSVAGTPDIRDCLPLWFNPNAIAVFPTIMTKQADMP